jgi:hypothetical protein
VDVSLLGVAYAFGLGQELNCRTFMSSGIIWVSDRFSDCMFFKFHKREEDFEVVLELKFDPKVLSKGGAVFSPDDGSKYPE